MHFDSMTPQDARAHPAGSLAAIDEENFLAIENRAAKGWWLVHPAPPKLERPLWRGDWSRLCSPKEGKSSNGKKIVAAFGNVEKRASAGLRPYFVVWSLANSSGVNLPALT